jgi:hypothetical protein
MIGGSTGYGNYTRIYDDTLKQKKSRVVTHVGMVRMLGRLVMCPYLLLFLNINLVFWSQGNKEEATGSLSGRGA